MKMISPPLKITNTSFDLEAKDSGTKKGFMVLSIHQPLNISLLTTAPIGWFFNTRKLHLQKINMLLIADRVPIFIFDNNMIHCIRLSNILKVNGSFATVNVTENDTKNIPVFEAWQKAYLGATYPIQDEKRQVYDKENNNAGYKLVYADAQYNAFTNPQSNDYFQGMDNIQNSSGGAISFLKCIIQTAMLGIVYATDWDYYTLSNAAVFIRIKDESNFKYTGKYWTKSYKKPTDATENGKDTKIPATEEILQRIFERVAIDSDLQKDIFKEIGDMEFTKENVDITKAPVKLTNYIIPKNEVNLDNTKASNELKVSFKMAKTLFLCTTGLEDFLKNNLALAFAGIIGRQWDYFLRYYNVWTGKEVKEEMTILKETHPEFFFVKNFGTPIATYIYALKDEEAQNDTIQGYNVLNFGRLLNEKIFSLSEKYRKMKSYTPLAIPNIIIPITFSTFMLECKTKCYRNYKQLLNFMKTRKQRDFLFDRLTQFGRRAMTVLDPYGIFMHYQGDDKIAQAN